MSTLGIRCFAIVTLFSILSGNAATLRHRYTFDSNGNDALNIAPLNVGGDAVTFNATGGAVGGYVRLGGSDDYLLASLDTGSPFALLGDYSTFRPFSISVWVRQTAAQAAANTQAIFGLTTNSTDSSTFNTGFELITRESTAGIGVRARARQGGSGSNAGEAVTNFSVSDGTWHHVVAVFESGSRTVYIDGNLQGINSVAVAITTNPLRYFTVGAFLRAGSYLDDFTGDLDDLQIYDGALTAAEATQLHATPGSTADGSGSTNLPLADIVDPLIGSIDTGSCVPGPCLPHSSIYPSPDCVVAAPGGFKTGSNVVGFSQLHAQGSGPSTMSYGNFLLSPQTGTAITTTEASHGSPLTNVIAHPYSYQGTLTAWNTNFTVVAGAHSAIYKFQFPATSTANSARLYMDVARKLNSATGMTGGSVTIDPVAGTISGGGAFSGNWNPAAYNVYFFAKVDATPTSGGTYIGSTASSPVTTPTTANFAAGQKLGGWLTFDTTSAQTVQLKIAVSFVSVAQAQTFLTNEIPTWDLTGLAATAKDRWNSVLSVLQTPGIGSDEGRKLYTALFHSLVQPRDRTGDAPGWPAAAPFWDDHYTNWDMWQTLFPLLAIVQPDAYAAVVNSYGERYARNGRAETAFIQGKDFQVGQGGDEVDLVIGEALAAQIPGIDWTKVWALLQFNSSRRTVDYLNRGYASSDGSPGGYDGRYKSGSTTLAFAYEDWCDAQVGFSLGKTAAAQTLLTRSGNWRNVWDPSLVGDGFSGFVRARNNAGVFSTSAATGGNDFYQGTCWNYSFNVFAERDAMIDLMGGRPRFIQRLEFALGQKSTSYIDYTNEVCFQSTWLFCHAGRPYLTSYWADQLRQLYGTNSMPGDEDSGAMSSLYFFATAGIFPAAGQDIYYLHGARVPHIEFHQSNGNTFAITAENSGGSNIYVQSATLNGVPLATPIIRHSDILAGGTLAFVMGPNPSTWGTGSDFAPNLHLELVLPVKGAWTASLGTPQIANAATSSPTWGAGIDGADNSAIQSAFPEVTLSQAGDSVTLAATVRFSGLATSQAAPASRFAWGLFNVNGQTGSTGWLGYLAANDTNAAGTQSLWKKAAGNTTDYHAIAGATALASFALATPVFGDDSYRLTLTLTRTASGALDYVAGLVRASDGVLLASFTGSDAAPATYTFNRVGLRAGDSLDADSIQVTDCTVVATRTTYTGRDLVVPDGAAFYLDSGEIDAANITNHGTIELTGGTLGSSGSITNTGTLRLKGGAALAVAGTLQNQGTIDTITSTGPLPANLQNSGTLLDRNSVKFDPITINGKDLSLTLAGYVGHTYQLQHDTSERLTGPWENRGSPMVGNGVDIHFDIPGGATDSAEFYRIQVDP